MSRAHVLYVDDDAGTARLVQKDLTRRGYKVTLAESGDEALQCLADDRADVVALDYHMPGMDGLATLAAIGERFANPPPVVFVTGSEEGRLAVAALKAGAADYVIKDVQGVFMSLLDSAIDQALASAELRRQKEAAEQALRASKEEADRANRAKTQLLAATGHDFKQPLSVIGIALDLISISGRVDSVAERHIARAQRAIEHLSRSLDKLLDAARLDAGPLATERTVLKLHELLEEVCDDWRPRAVDKGLDLRVVRTGAVVETDRYLLRSILTNLVGNAVKYTERGKILVGVRRRAATVQIWVADTGIGIAADELPTIFEEFRQIEPGRDGFGLGLSIVRRTAEALGHRVDVRSEPKRGTIFVVEMATSSNGAVAESA